MGMKAITLERSASVLPLSSSRLTESTMARLRKLAEKVYVVAVLLVAFVIILFFLAVLNLEDVEESQSGEKCS